MSSATLPDTQTAITEPKPAAIPSRRAVLLTWLAGEPLVVPSFGLILGIAIDSFITVPLVAALIIAAVSATAFRLRRRSEGWRWAVVLMLAATVGMVRHDLCMRHWPADHIVQYVRPSGTFVRLTGTVIDAPAVVAVDTGIIEWFPQSPRTRMHVAAETIEGRDGELAVCGTVAVMIREPALQVSAGDRVELFGQMYCPGPPANPGERDYSLASRRKGVLVNMTCELAANVKVLPARAGWRSRLNVFRDWARASMLDDTYRGYEPGSQVLAAMVLGQRSAVGQDLNDAFTATGTIHYLSVSGAHVAMLASVVWLAGMLAGRSRRTTAVWAILAITAYAVLAEPRPPILRAALMGNLLCIAILLRRPVRTLNWMAASAILLLLLQPTQLFDAGFQLSFLSVLGILYLVPPVHQTGRRMMDLALRRDDPLLTPEIQDLIDPPRGVRWLWRYGSTAMGWVLALTVAGWLSSLLLVAHLFHRVALWGPIDNILVLPLMWIVQVLGLLKMAVGLVCPPAAAWLGYPLAGSTNALLDLVEYLARLPGAGWSTPAVPIWLVFLGGAVLVFWVLTGWLRIRERWVGMMAAAVALIVVWTSASRGTTDTCTIHLLAIGAGQACIVELPNGRTLVCDMGSRPPYNLQRWTVGPFLAHRRIHRIDDVVVSHANLDHYSSLPDLAEHYAVGTLFIAPHFEQSAATGGSGRRVLAALESRGVDRRSVQRGDRLMSTGDTQIEILWPPPLDEFDNEDPNECSIVLRLSYAGRRVLICGDIDAQAQAHLLASKDLRADVLVLPHHGSLCARSAEFVAAVDPSYCLRSSGQRDEDTHNGLLDMMAGRRYFNTADDGAIEVRITPDGLAVSAFRQREE